LNVAWKNVLLTVSGVSGLALESAARLAEMAKKSVRDLLSKMRSMVGWNARAQARKKKNVADLALSIANGRSGQTMVLVQKNVAQVKKSGLAGLLWMQHMVVSHAKVLRRRLKIVTKRNVQLIVTSLIGSKSEIAVSPVVVAFIQKKGPSINRLSLVVRNVHPISNEMCLVICGHAQLIVSCLTGKYSTGAVPHVVVVCTKRSVLC
jgi:hypothetical protein